jgi:hypothetical protein
MTCPWARKFLGDVQLRLRWRASEHDFPAVREDVPDLRLVPVVEVLGGHDPRFSAADPDLTRDRGYRQRMVTGDDDDADPGGVASRDRAGRLGPRRVEYRDQAEEAQAALGDFAGRGQCS